MYLKSQIYITLDFESLLQQLKSEAQGVELSLFQEGDVAFGVQDLEEVFAKAYLTTSVDHYIVIVAKTLSVVVQNKLLKILEEPPKNKHFILVTESKSTILPTVRSRLLLTKIKSTVQRETLTIDLATANAKDVFVYLKEVMSAKDRVQNIRIVEELLLTAKKSNRFVMDTTMLEMFDSAIRALHLRASGGFVVSTLVANLFARTK